MEPLPLPAREPGHLYRTAWVLYLGLAVGGVLWIGLRRGLIPLALFVDVHRWWLDLLLGAGVGLLLLGVWTGAERASPMARELERRLALALGPIRPGEAIALALLSGFAEELFFRGAVQGAFGFLPASLLFALLHTGPGRPFRLWTAFAALAGLLCGALLLWRGNLLAPITAHFVVNAINLRSLSRRLVDSARLTPPEEES